MSIINQYITFLNEYRKLLERGVKNIFASSIINKFIWVDDISKLTDRNLCDSFLPLLFVNQLEKKNEKRLLSVDERYADVEKNLLKERKAQKEVEIKERLKVEAAISIL